MWNAPPPLGSLIIQLTYELLLAIGGVMWMVAYLKELRLSNTDEVKVKFSDLKLEAHHAYRWLVWANLVWFVSSVIALGAIPGTVRQILNRLTE